MNPQQAIEFIRSQLIRGQAREEIEQTLRMNNVPENEITLAFNAAEWQKNQNLTSPTYKIRRHGMVWLTIILLIIIGASGAGAYIVLFRPDLLNQILNKTPVTSGPISPTPPAPPVVTPVATSTATSATMNTATNATTNAITTGEWNNLIVFDAKIKYPPEWQVKNPLSNYPDTISPIRYIATPGLNLENFDLATMKIPADQAIVQFFGKSSAREDLSTIRTQIESANDKNNHPDQLEIRDLLVNGSPAIRATFSDATTNNRHIYYVIKITNPLGKILYGLDLATNDSENKTAELVAIFEKIVRTFTPPVS